MPTSGLTDQQVDGSQVHHQRWKHQSPSGQSWSTRYQMTDRWGVTCETTWKWKKRAVYLWFCKRCRRSQCGRVTVQISQLAGPESSNSGRRARKGTHGCFVQRMDRKGGILVAVTQKPRENILRRGAPLIVAVTANSDQWWGWGIALETWCGWRYWEEVSLEWSKCKYNL